ncbi:MAG TPA: pitrilysin family protein [Candidatus Acidoferrales bacterium]|nr:pitrilysin family protein [Candidatus Acidoferrales bacterium]
MPSPTAERLQLDPLPFRERLLANGLRAITLEDHRSATAAVNIAYRVGGKDDPPGRSGFAHLFEHLMFKGTKRTGAETIDRLTEDVGGFNNAFTTEDYTNYYEVIPSNYLETILWAEADRLSGLIVDAANFDTERDVVISEYDQRVLAEPYGMLSELAMREAYRVHPYGRGVIGDPENLRAATLDDVRAFHATYYRPDNATLVVVGDFENDAIDKWIDDYFGSIARPKAEIPRVTALEPPSGGERRLSYQSANAPLPALNMTWHIGRARDPQTPVLDIIETLLGTGKSSRLYRALVYEHQAATSVWAGADWNEDPGTFTIRAMAAAGVELGRIEALIEEQIALLSSRLVEAAELEKAKVQLYSGTVRGLSTYNEIAQTIVRSAVVRGSARLLDDDVARYNAVDAEQVRSVTAQTFVPERRSVIEYLAVSA